jgi:hypothetical protein
MKTPKKITKQLSPPKTKAKPKKKANAASSKKQAAPIFGSAEFRIWRVFDEEAKCWKRWSRGSKHKKETESHIHRFAREVGFSSMAEGELDDVLKKVEERLRNIIHNLKSEVRRVKNQGNFEVYILKTHPTDSYAQFSSEIENATEKQRPIMVPSQLLLSSYVLHMSDTGDQMDVGILGWNNNYNSVHGRLGEVSGTLREFGVAEGIKKDGQTTKLLMQ